jgi:NAD(P)-dependent dehydrogenase (short-subunit alcohol dehydrogenase family)
MSRFSGKTAVISGGGEGIGLSIARALGEQGMNIVLGDIDPGNLERATQELEQAGVPVLAVVLDVAEEAQWQALVQRTVERFQTVHMLVNNAGVAGASGPIESQSAVDWDWALHVNLMGVVFGAKHFVPLIKEHGEGGWLVNVASMAGMGGLPFAGAYTATKSAVVALSESWVGELEGDGIAVSVLCPAFVQTRIHDSQRNRQARFEVQSAPVGADGGLLGNATEAVKNGIDPSIVGKRLVEALEAGELYVFTHPNYRPVVQMRSEMIDAAFERAAASPLLQDIAKQDIAML